MVTSIYRLEDADRVLTYPLTASTPFLQEVFMHLGPYVRQPLIN
jgi:hypothetical protein